MDNYMSTQAFPAASPIYQYLFTDNSISIKEYLYYNLGIPGFFKKFYTIVVLKEQTIL